MKRVVGAILSSALLASCVTTQVEEEANVFASYKAPEVGTKFVVNYISEDSPDGPDQFEQVVVATGEDYAVYAIPDEELGLQADSFFIEYSGVFWQVCGDRQPDQSERLALQGLWPLEAGKTATVTSSDVDGSIRKVDVSVLALETDTSDAFGEQPVASVHSAVEFPEYMRFAPQLSTPLRIDWGEPGSANYDGYDELVSIEKTNLEDYALWVDFGAKICAPQPLNG